MTTINHLKQTHTFVVMELPQEMVDYIAQKFRDAGYDHVFNECEGRTVIDMNGVAIGAEDPDSEEVIRDGKVSKSVGSFATGGGLGSRSEFKYFDDLAATERPTTEVKSLPPIVQSFQLDPENKVEEACNAIAQGVEDLFNQHPKKQPEVSAHTAVATDEQIEQLNEDPQWQPVAGMNIVDTPSELLSLRYESVFCETCNKKVDVLIPLSAKGGELPYLGSQMFEETLGENELFTLCGTNQSTGSGIIYKVKIKEPGKVQHISGPLS